MDNDKTNNECMKLARILTNSIGMNKFLFFVLLILIGCQNSKNTRNIFLLNDSLFKFHNVKQLSFPDNINEYVAMDSIQKSILFKPYLANDLKAISFGFDAYFVSNNCGNKRDRLFFSMVNASRLKFCDNIKDRTGT